MYEITCYAADYEDGLMDLIRQEGEDWRVYWDEPNASRYRASFSQSITYVALADGKPCGYVRALEDALFVYICDLLVTQQHRGHGLGNMLMQHIQKAYPNHPVYVMSGNDAYYQTLGAIKEGSIYLL